MVSRRQRLAFVATGRDGKQLLWVRRLESLSAEALPGTDVPPYPFWSADNQFVGFFAQRKLKRVGVSGGPRTFSATRCCHAAAHGNSRGEIVFAAAAGRKMFRVSATGGAAATAAGGRIEPGGHWPSFLPDGRHYGVYSGDPRHTASRRFHRLLCAKLLLSDYFGAAYAAPGYLVGVRLSSRGATAGTLFAQPFDPTRLNSSVSQCLSPSGFSTSLDSRAPRSRYPRTALSYGTAGESTTRLTWFDRRGNALDTVVGSESYGRPALSPDEKTLAVERSIRIRRTRTSG